MIDQIQPKVSVCITAYNHAAFIAQALDSVLSQKTSFPFEIIVGEDDSSDGTREVVRHYVERHPDLIRTFFNDRKNVIYVNGRPTGRWNFMNNIRHARGEYVALLDGDDYWTDKLKLQLQVDALDQNPEYSFSFHNAEYWREKDSLITGTYHENFGRDRVTLADIVGSFFIPTCSVVFRNGLFKEFPDWFTKVAFADWPLHVLNAQHGPALYIDRLMARHRIHDGGYWTSTGRIEMIQSSIACADILDAHLGYEYSVPLTENRYVMNQELILLSLKEDRIKSFGLAVLRSFKLRGTRSFWQQVGALPMLNIRWLAGALYRRLQRIA